MIQLAHRIILTELCNKSCDHCFNANFRKRGVMDSDKLIHFMRENSHHLPQKNLRLMGGEPTLHPKFLEVVEEGCKHYKHVNVFTNGSTLKKITKEPVMINNHNTRKILYLVNGHTFDPDGFSEYEQFLNFFTIFCVVPLDNVELFVERVIEFSNLSHKIHIILSNDTQVELLTDDEVLEKYRVSWMKALTEIVPILGEKGASFSFDHFFPVCFYTQEMIDILHLHNLEGVNMQICCCGEMEMGLIDYNFDLYHCNQTRIKLGNILNDDGNIKTLEDITLMLQKGAKLKVDSIMELSDKCRKCVALPNCKIGCYYNALSKKEMMGSC